MQHARVWMKVAEKAEPQSDPDQSPQRVPVHRPSPEHCSQESITVIVNVLYSNFTRVRIMLD